MSLCELITDLLLKRFLLNLLNEIIQTGLMVIDKVESQKVHSRFSISFLLKRCQYDMNVTNKFYDYRPGIRSRLVMYTSIPVS